MPEPSETPQWRITKRLASIEFVVFHIALGSLFHLFFLICQTPILNNHSSVVGNCDHTRSGFIGYAPASGLQCDG